MVPDYHAIERVVIPSAGLNAVGIESSVVETNENEELKEELKSILRRNPLVTCDDQFEKLEGCLIESGPDGLFFTTVVATVKSRILFKQDVHKTANSTLRCIFAEAYLAHLSYNGWLQKRCVLLFSFYFLLVVIIKIFC